MPTVIIPDKMCPNCNGNKWFLQYNKYKCKDGTISLHLRHRCDHCLKEYKKKKGPVWNKNYHERVSNDPERVKHRRQARMDKYYNRHDYYKEQSKIHRNKYVANNKDIVSFKKRNERTCLSNSYVKDTIVNSKSNIRLTYHDITPELIELQRTSLTLKRHLKQQKWQQLEKQPQLK